MDVTDIRANNIKDILSALRFTDGLTKKEIAQITSLSFSTVSNMCNLLKEKQVLLDEKIESTSVGRTPNRLVFQYNRFCSICLDLQMEHVLGFAILNFKNEILYHRHYDISSCGTPEEMIRYAYGLFGELRSSPWLDDSLFVGVGVAVSGVFDQKSRLLVNCAIPAMENIPLAEMIESVFHLPCYIDNEANLCVVAMRQKNKNAKNLLYLHLSEGAGVGIICEGKLLRGKNGYAAEISHLPFGEPGIRCLSCGGYGCVESDLSIRGLLRGLKNEEQSLALHTRWQKSVEQINRDPASFSEFLGNRGHTIGFILTILINLFDPEIVYLGGSISEIYPHIEPYILSPILERCPHSLGNGLTLCCDRDSDTAIYLGINQIMYEKWNPLGEHPRKKSRI